MHWEENESYCVIYQNRLKIFTTIKLFFLVSWEDLLIVFYLLRIKGDNETWMNRIIKVHDLSLFLTHLFISRLNQLANKQDKDKVDIRVSNKSFPLWWRRKRAWYYFSFKFTFETFFPLPSFLPSFFPNLIKRVKLKRIFLSSFSFSICL